MQPTPPYTVRAATSEDLPPVEWLLSEAQLPVEGVEEWFEPSYVVAITADGDVIAAAGVEQYGPVGLLRSVVVHPVCQHRGIGAAVVRDRLAWAKGVGIRTLYLLTTTATTYFRKFGFNVINRADSPRELHQSVEFSSACSDDAVLMALSLGGSAPLRH
jgi:N-acetylglutamate synthase-like GNAT family acetyltransferase